MTMHDIDIMTNGSNKKDAKRNAVTVAKLVAIEDIKRGDFVAPHLEVCEFISPACFMDLSYRPSRRIETLYVELRPDDAGTPLKVLGVCAPYVLTKTPGGDARTIDTRECRLVRLDPRYGRRAFKALRPRPEKDASDGPRRRKRKRTRKRRRKRK